MVRSGENSVAELSKIVGRVLRDKHRDGTPPKREMRSDWP
jgi:hypothetical protein